MTTSLFGQATIIGKWKPIKVSFRNHFTKTSNTIYQVGKTDSIKTELLRLYTAQNNSDSELVHIDTTNFKKKLETVYNFYQLAGLEFKKTTSFLLKSFGLIVPIAEPGWHFGDKLIGNWTTNKNKLKLTIGNKKINHMFFYKIQELTTDRLIIEQTNADYEEVFNEIIFVRQ